MYFEKKGPKNTAKTVELAIARARELEIKYIVAASNMGATAAHLLPYAKEFNITVLSQAFGYPQGRVMEAETRQKLEAGGITVLHTTHALSGAERGLSNRFGGVYPVEIIAHTLRMLGQGTKVCVEIATMAFDGGLLPEGEDIIAIGGSGRGADTALVIKPAHANNILDTYIREIICKPR